MSGKIQFILLIIVMTSKKVIFHYENCSFAKVIKFYDWFVLTQERDGKSELNMKTEKLDGMQIIM